MKKNRYLFIKIRSPENKQLYCSDTESLDHSHSIKGIKLIHTSIPSIAYLIQTVTLHEKFDSFRRISDYTFSRITWYQAYMVFIIYL